MTSKCCQLRYLFSLNVSRHFHFSFYFSLYTANRLRQSLGSVGPDDTNEAVSTGKWTSSNKSPIEMPKLVLLKNIRKILFFLPSSPIVFKLFPLCDEPISWYFSNCFYFSIVNVDGIAVLSAVRNLILSLLRIRFFNRSTLLMGE